MIIGIDAMGGDNAPKAIIDGVIEAKKNIDAKFVLYGNKDIIVKYVNDKDIDIVHCTQIIENADKPVMEIRRKKDSSLVRGFLDLKEKKIDGFLSAGNTGAILVGGMFVTGRIEGIKRPAITSIYPTLNNGISLLCDAGANADCKPEFLLKFAEMSSLYSSLVLGVKNPKIGLVNVGSESTKGNQLVIETHELLRNSNLNFIGNVEGRDLAFGVSDIIITDGFTGNIILKLTEGLAKSFGIKLKNIFKQNPINLFCGILLKKSFDKFKQDTDYREYGGAPLLGVNGYVVKAHGSSDKKAIVNAIKYLKKYIESEMVEKIRNENRL